MTRGGMPVGWEKWALAVASGFLGSMLTLLQPYTQQLFDKAPILVKEIYVSKFSPPFCSQLTAFPLKYALVHKSGGSARNISIFIKANRPFTLSEIRFDSWCEPYLAKQLENAVRIDVPIIRPGGNVTFELLTDGKGDINFHERVEFGEVVDIGSFARGTEESNVFKLSIIGGIFLLCVMVMFFTWRRITPNKANAADS